jgi:hypothetical protein
MTDRLIRSSADMVAIFRARIAELGITHETVDEIAEWGDGYCSKILAGMKTPTASTIARMCSALALVFRSEVDTERETILKARWVKRRRT